MSDPGKKRTVRLFPGYAESPLWTTGGPLRYEESCLSSELIEHLRSWEQSGYTEGAAHSETAGVSTKDLARRLASELGRRFSVAIDGADGDSELISSEDAATNSEAEQAFDVRFAEEEAEAKKLGTQGMEMFAPNSRQVFPNETEQ